VLFATLDALRARRAAQRGGASEVGDFAGFQVCTHAAFIRAAPTLFAR
jgi:hypothetical protein